MQFRHAVGARALEAHHRDKVFFQLAGLERVGQILLILEHHRRGFDDLVLRRHGGDFHHTAPEVAFHHAQAAFRRKRTGHRAQDGFVEAFDRAIAPDQLAIDQERFLGVTAQALAGHGVDIFVQQTGFEQFADQERHAARCLEVVDVGFAVWIHVGQGRYHLGEVGHVLPGEDDACRHGDRRHVQGVVGGTAGGIERHDGVDDGFLVDDLADRREAAVGLGQAGDLVRGFAGQRITQRRVRVDERGARQVQAHDFHQQLVGVGGAVEGAGAGAVVGLHLRFQQFFAAGLAFGIALAHIGLLLVGNARRHRAARYEDHRQVTVAQRAHHQARHDLVADAQHQRRVEHVVGQRYRRGHRDDFTAQQAQLHAGLTLGHAIAHGGRASGELADRTDFAQGFFDVFREVFVRLMRREHVVI